VYSAAMQKKLTDLMSGEGFDIVQIESSQMAGFVFDERTVRVLDEHNIEYELLQRMFLTERSASRRVYNRLEFLKFRREEIDSWRSVSGVISTSVREERIIGEIAPSTPTMVAPNAVDIEYFQPSAQTVEPHAIVMTGLMHYRPNIDGARYFIEEVFPLILAVRPRAVFYVVGAGASTELKRLASANVVITDTVPDVRPYVHRSAVFVVPLRMGGGTRLKVLEGLAMEKAVVSTSIGCEGLEVVDKNHLLIADDQKTFADSVLALMDNPRLRLTLGKRGRMLAAEKYRWETVVEGLETFYARLLEAASRS
jgi:glycosyltransferase involved in cell wall biosynthesis